jgi:hypothetical protein
MGILAKRTILATRAKPFIGRILLLSTILIYVLNLIDFLGVAKLSRMTSLAGPFFIALSIYRLNLPKLVFKAKASEVLQNEENLARAVPAIAFAVFFLTVKIFLDSFTDLTYNLSGLSTVHWSLEAELIEEASFSIGVAVSLGIVVLLALFLLHKAIFLVVPLKDEKNKKKYDESLSAVLAITFFGAIGGDLFIKTFVLSVPLVIVFSEFIHHKLKVDLFHGAIDRYDRSKTTIEKSFILNWINLKKKPQYSLIVFLFFLSSCFVLVNVRFLDPGQVRELVFTVLSSFPFLIAFFSIKAFVKNWKVGIAALVSFIPCLLFVYVYPMSFPLNRVVLSQFLIVGQISVGNLGWIPFFLPYGLTILFFFWSLGHFFSGFSEYLLIRKTDVGIFCSCVSRLFLLVGLALASEFLSLDGPVVELADFIQIAQENVIHTPFLLTRRNPAMLAGLLLFAFFAEVFLFFTSWNGKMRIAVKSKKFAPKKMLAFLVITSLILLPLLVMIDSTLMTAYKSEYYASGICQRTTEMNYTVLPVVEARSYIRVEVESVSGDVFEVAVARSFALEYVADIISSSSGTRIDLNTDLPSNGDYYILFALANDTNGDSEGRFKFTISRGRPEILRGGPLYVMGIMTAFVILPEVLFALRLQSKMKRNKHLKRETTLLRKLKFSFWHVRNV